MAAGILAAFCFLRVAEAQVWRVDVGAGAATHQAITERTTSSLNLGVRLDSPTWIYGAGGIPLDDDGLPWLAAGSGGRQATAGVHRLGIDFETHGYRYRAAELEATGSGVIMEALPFLATRLGNARLEGFGGAQHYSSSFLGESTSRTLFLGGLRAIVAASPDVTLSGETRYAFAEEGGYPYAGVRLAWARGPVGAWAGIGRWVDEVIPTAEWSLGGYLDAGDRARVTLGVRQDTNDPLFWNEPRRSWNVGVSYAVGGRPPSRRLAPPELAEGHAIFRVALAESRGQPEIAGTFTDWIAVPMQREEDAWVARLHVPSGVHHYAFRDADGNWFLPASTPNRVDDGFGGENAVLIVP